MLRHPHQRAAIALGLILAASAALAANGIDVRRGEDSTVFGNCVPSLVVENKSGETIDYLQVDVAVALGNGQERLVIVGRADRIEIGERRIEGQGHRPVAVPGSAAGRAVDVLGDRTTVCQ